MFIAAAVVVTVATVTAVVVVPVATFAVASVTTSAVCSLLLSLCSLHRAMKEEKWREREGGTLR